MLLEDLIMQTVSHHECLEGWQGIALPKEHDHGFIEAIGSDEHSLPLVSFLDTNVVVPPSNIHLREVFGSFQFVDEGGDEGKGVCILNDVFIEVSVGLARA